VQQIRFPVSELLALVDIGRSFSQRNTVFCVLHGPGGAIPTALALSARQVAPPGIAVRAADLVVDEAVDRFMTDLHAILLLRQPACDLFGRPPHSKVAKNVFLQVWLSHQTAAAPTPRPSLLIGIGGFIADARPRITLQLPRDCRWRAIQSCSDFPDRLP